MKGRRVSASRASAAILSSSKQVEAADADIENFGPPEWRTVLNCRADLGYPDFYPSRPGFHQAEDVLTEEFVKNGFSAKTFVAVGAESFSMHGPIHNHLLNGCLDMLNKLGQEIAEKRDEGTPQIGERAFRIPVRVTYNDTKRLQFLADLADPSVPLHRLMRNPVPHGFKGMELFDTMFAPSLGSPAGHNRSASGSGGSFSSATFPEPIPVERAVWFIRVLGANEISAHRGRAQPVTQPVAAPSPAAATPSSTNTTPATPAHTLTSNDWYTQDFTTLFTSWLRIQLSQLSLPTPRSTIKSGVPLPKVVAGVLGDDKARARWLAKWDYGSKVLRELHTRYLISSRLLCVWLADTLAVSNLAQLGFVVKLIGEYLPDISRHVSIGRSCVRAICERLKEIQASPASSSLVKVEAMMKYTVGALFSANPKVLLSPATWRYHGELLNSLLLPSSNQDSKEELPPGTTALGSGHVLKRLLDDVKRRSEALTFTPIATESTTSPRRHQMEDLHKLDAMNADTDMVNLCKIYYDGSASPLSGTVDISRLEEKTFVLLNWAMGIFQLGIHRAYAVHTLLKIWSDQYEQHQAKSARTRDVDFFSILYKWLDTSEAARMDSNAFAVGIVFGELTRQGFFSYGRYIQTLIAQGQTARSRLPDSPPSHHLALLGAMPIFVQAKDLSQQRRLALYGDDVETRQREEAEEERMMAAFKDEVREFVPEVFGWKRYGQSASLNESANHQMSSVNTLSRHLFLQTRFWIYQAAIEHLKGRDGCPAMNGSTFARLIHILHLCNGFSTTADFLIQALRTCEDEEILSIVCDSIRRDADMWTAMDRWSPIIDALMDRKQAQDAKGRHHAGLAILLLELAGKGRLSEEDGEEIKASMNQHPKDRTDTTVGWVDAKESMAALQQALSAGNIQAATSLSSKLFTRHGPFSTWSTLWWSTVIKALQVGETSKSSSVINASLAHIEEIDNLTDGTLDTVVSSWIDLLTFAQTTDMLSTNTHSIFSAVLLNLVAHRRLHIVPKLLERLVYSSWKHSASTVLSSNGRIVSRVLRAVESTVTLAQHLLLTSPPNRSLPPINMRQALVLQTERGKAFDVSNVPTLIRHLPFLVVLDTARGCPQHLRDQISTLLRGLAVTPPFKAAAFRHLNVLKDSFLSNEWSKPTLDSSVEAGMVDALKLIMSQGSASSKDLDSIASLDSSSRFSAWRWTSIVLGMRVDFKRLAMRIENGDNAAQARQTLNQLVHATLDRDTNADDTDLLCETFRGIEAVAAQEIVAVGLERLKTLLSQMVAAETQTALQSCCKSVDLMLRVLDSASMAPATGQTELSVLSARHALLDLISVAFQAVERKLTNEDDIQLIAGLDPPQPGDLLAVSIKLLIFTLGLSVIEAPSPASPRPDFGRLAGSLLRVIAVLSKHEGLQAMESLIDTLIYVVDSAPSISRSAVHSALMSETTSPPLATALDDRPELSSALPALSFARRPVALTNPSIIDVGTADASLAFDDRPWEMFEQTNPPSRRPPQGELYLASKPVRDTASIPMSLFDPHMKRDALPETETSAAEKDEDGEASEDGSHSQWENYASERNLGDGLAGEPMSVKQLTTSLFAGPEEATVEDDITIHTAHSPLPGIGALSPSNTLSALPTPGRPRRSSTRLAAGGRGLSNKDPISLVDEEDEDEDDPVDDDEEGGEPPQPPPEAPAGKRPRIGSKSTIGSSMGGKTVRKTTGGKSVARKATGGKSLRGVSGKAPKGSNRRRSIAD